jgi:uncharacterized membrane protein
MKKMFRIASAVLLFSFISFSSNAMARAYSDTANEGFVISGPLLGIAGIITILSLAVTFSILDYKRELKKAKA